MRTRTFFTSDTHFYHGNVIRYTDRPWAVRWHGDVEKCRPSEILGKSVREVSYDELRSTVLVDVIAMNRDIVAAWNDVVGPLDTVYHLGDFAFGPRQLLAPMRAKLNGKIILVRGNHDRSKNVMLEAGFDEVHEKLNVTVDGVDIFMSHQPERNISAWNRAALHLCGHVHEKWRRKGPMINVGVDQWGFRPRELGELQMTQSQGLWPSNEEVD